jgi:histidine ammonia-lyase
MVAIPKDVSTLPAAAAHIDHFAMGTKAARPLLNIPTDLRNAFIEAGQARQLSSFPHLDLCLHNNSPTCHQ